MRGLFLRIEVTDGPRRCGPLSSKDEACDFMEDLLAAFCHAENAMHASEQVCVVEECLRCPLAISEVTMPSEKAVEGGVDAVHGYSEALRQSSRLQPRRTRYEQM